MVKFYWSHSVEIGEIAQLSNAMSQSFNKIYFISIKITSTLKTSSWWLWIRCLQEKNFHQNQIDWCSPDTNVQPQKWNHNRIYFILLIFADKWIPSKKLTRNNDGFTDRLYVVWSHHRFPHFVKTKIKSSAKRKGFIMEKHLEVSKYSITLLQTWNNQAPDTRFSIALSSRFFFENFTGLKPWTEV